MICVKLTLILATSSILLLFASAAHEDHQHTTPTTITDQANGTSSSSPMSSSPTEPSNLMLTQSITTTAASSTIVNHNSTAGQITQLANTTVVSDTKRPTSLPLIDGAKTIVDLSHPLDENTLHWPKSSGFIYESLIDDVKKNEHNISYYVKSDAIHTGIHCGTHLDAPRHFSKDGWTVDKIPLERLIDVPLHVIDLSDKIKANRTYNFLKEDFIDSKTKKPLVLAKSVVFVYTGISQYYRQGEKAYFGTDTKNISNMRIPGFSKEAALYLVELGIYGVGLDAPSADSSDRHGSNETYDPVAHVIFNSNNIYILENISNRLQEMVKQTATMRLTIAPLAITGGSGSPIRLLAITAHDDCAHYFARNSAPNRAYFVTLITICLSTFVSNFMFNNLEQLMVI